MLLVMLQQTLMMKLQQKLLQKNVTADVADDVLALDAASDVATDVTDFVVPTADEIPRFRLGMLFPLWKRFGLKNYVSTDVASEVAANATNFVVPTADKILAWVPIANKTPTMEQFPVGGEIPIVERTYAQDSIEANCTAITPKKKNVGPKDADASNNIGMMENEDVYVTKNIELVAGVMVEVHIAN
uniref:Uncharacterized protein n=1 Tax=Fagus sylvatica TaxID=28930 RepID=A0A2N9IBY9_FAGSY